MYQTTTYDQRDVLIKTHMGFVDFVVQRMRPQIPVFISMEELKSAAMYGLIEAAGRFDPGKGILFKTYAETRIRGAVMDEVRKMDWFSRSMREKHTRMTKEIKKLEQQLGRGPTEVEIAEAMDMSTEDYQKLLNEIGHLSIVSLNEILGDSFNGETFLHQLKDVNGKSPEEQFGTRELIQEVADEIDKLPEKERLVLTLFYHEEFTQKEIAEIMELSEGRISQLHTQALLKLKARMLD
ncbi:MAG: FliA/WhiG family RNA polymerase sigma factor [Desulfobacterales bacterium]